MKTLFLKSNLLHIRTNEGEFEVSNPELIGAINIDWQSFILIHPYRTVNGNWFIEDNDEVEWPGGVELIESCIKGSCAEANECIQPHYCVAKKIKDKTASTSVVREGEWPNTSTPPSFESSEPHEKYLRFEKELARKIIDLIFTEKYVFLGDYSDGYENPEKAFKDIIPIIHEAFKKSVSAPSEISGRVSKKSL